MTNPFRKADPSLEEIHRYMADIRSLQEQQNIAYSLGRAEQGNQYGITLELAHKVLQRLLERAGKA